MTEAQHVQAERTANLTLTYAKHCRHLGGAAVLLLENITKHRIGIHNDIIQAAIILLDSVQDLKTDLLLIDPDLTHID